jgi:hypothetical protein
MQVVVNVALPVFAIMLAGFLAGRFRLLGEDGATTLNTFVYWFALPPVLFLAMARVPFGMIFDWPFLLTFILGMAATAALALVVARLAFPNSFAGTTLHVLTATFANTGYMGIPLTLAAYGGGGTLPAVITTAFGACARRCAMPSAPCSGGRCSWRRSPAYCGSGPACRCRPGWSISPS